MYKALFCSVCAAVILVSGAHLYDQHAERKAVATSVRNLIVTLDDRTSQPKRIAEEVTASNNLRDAW